MKLTLPPPFLFYGWITATIHSSVWSWNPNPTMPCPEKVTFNPMDIELMIPLCWDATSDCSLLQSLKPRNKRGCHREVALLGLEVRQNQLIATAYCMLVYPKCSNI
ncbi:hypothetical protein NC651_006025 [Populus alba x Populus x berolinensis]|nr:hypothetical protein NC651_006016 [Populus alba x Populus x berolinensis]KAJ6939730.1 hypothetical protein NC651_006025 [Populus alba x Populus x berolinensis]